MMNLQMRIKYVQDELVKYNDDLFKNQEDLKLITSSKGDPTQKTKTINDIKSNQKIKTQEIEKLKKDSITAQNNFKKKMDEIKKEMQDSSKKITSF
jgi:predicted transcriptional regulator